MPAGVVLFTWFGYQFMLGLMDLGSTGGGVAFWAHIGGFVAGWVLIRLFVPTNKPPRQRGAGLWGARRGR